MTPSVRELLAGTDDLDRLDVEVLLAEALAVNRAWLVAHADDPVDEAALRRFRDWVNRRRAGEPVAYLTGWREFWSLRLRVTPDTLIPRPETEDLVAWALAHLPEDRPLDVLDLGTGSGAIALAVSSERPRAQIVATDRSIAALSVARANARRLQLDRIECIASDWYAELEGRRFDLILSNPPYVRADDPHLTRGDCAWEPRQALTPGDDGLDAYRQLLAGFHEHARPGAWLAVEHGFDQREAVSALFLEAGLTDVETRDDLAGVPRIVAGRCPTPGSP